MKVDDQLDLLGVGIGPFNLGLAALTEEKTKLRAMFFDKTEVFEWHPGMLLEQSDLQVPFLADLTTLANPTSQYTFLNYLHAHNRMFQFYFFKRFDVPRVEYNAYCKWVITQLSSCYFGYEVTDLFYDKEETCYVATVKKLETDEVFTYQAKHVVLGTGSVPMVPPGIEEQLNEDIVHTSRYKHHQEEFKQSRSVTVVGSGQSAAEVFLDLLYGQKEGGYHLHWLTQSPAFLQLESGKLGQEVFSTDYVDYFHALPYDKRKDSLPMLGGLRNGVEAETLREIYDLLYHRSIERNDPPVMIQATTSVNGLVKTSEGTYELQCEQWQKEQEFTLETEKLVLATGYKPHIPDWLMNMKEEFEWESDKEYKVTRDYRLSFHDKRDNHLFTLTNLEHSHGASATNLALSVTRNQTIINKIAEEEVYPLQPNTVFQQFSPNEN